MYRGADKRSRSRGNVHQRKKNRDRLWLPISFLRSCRESSDHQRTISKHPGARYRSLPEKAADMRRASRRTRRPVGDRYRRKMDRVSGSICLLPTRLAICGKTGRLPVGRRPADNGGSLLISFGRGPPRDGPFVTVSRRSVTVDVLLGFTLANVSFAVGYVSNTFSTPAVRRNGREEVCVDLAGKRALSQYLSGSSVFPSLYLAAIGNLASSESSYFYSLPRKFVFIERSLAAPYREFRIPTP